MDDATLLTHLNACITGRLEYRRAPKFANYLDALLGNHRFVSGFKPAVGGRHIRVVAPAGFPLESHAEVTAFLNELAIPYRWSTRAIFLDPQTAVRELSVWRRNWFQKRLGFAGILKETFGSGTAAAFQNQHALQMAADADERRRRGTRTRGSILLLHHRGHRDRRRSGHCRCKRPERSSSNFSITASTRASNTSTPTRHSSARFPVTVTTTSAGRCYTREISRTFCRSPAHGQARSATRAHFIRKQARHSATPRRPVRRHFG